MPGRVFVPMSPGLLHILLMRKPIQASIKSQVWEEGWTRFSLKSNTVYLWLQFFPNTPLPAIYRLNLAGYLKFSMRHHIHTKTNYKFCIFAKGLEVRWRVPEFFIQANLFASQESRNLNLPRPTLSVGKIQRICTVSKSWISNINGCIRVVYQRLCFRNHSVSDE